MMGLIPQIARAVIIAVAHAAQPTGTLMLACKGESTLTMIGGDASPQEPVSMGIIVSFKEEKSAGSTATAQSRASTALERKSCCLTKHRSNLAVMTAT